MTRRLWIPSLMLGWAACGLSGCLFPAARDPGPTPADKHGDAAASRPTPDGSSAYHAHPAPTHRDDGPTPDPVEPAHFPDAPTPAAKKDEPPPPPPITPPPPPDAAVTADKAGPEPEAVAAFRDLLQNRSAQALERLRAYDGASREVLLTLLPLAARAGDGGLDRASPQETALLLDQVRQLESLLRPRAALTLDKVCLCRKINGFGDCDPWPDGHVFQPAVDGRYGERVQVYVEVRNFTCRPRDAVFETSLAGVVEVRDFTNRPICRFDFPACVERSQTPRQDYFVNFQFRLPPMPEGRYTLHVLVKDLLAPPGGDAVPRSAGRSLDFSVGGAGVARD